jgi:hypothetical protein
LNDKYIISLIDMENIKNLLRQVAIISRKNAEILDATGGRFNMFCVCGVNHYENTHSAIIAELLNPQGAHGLKAKLLKCFIETLDADSTIKDFDCENAIVRTEHVTNVGRIDILIEEYHKKRAIIIENKIYASDQWEQLKRYSEYAKRTYTGGYQMLYLTLEGNEASEQSGGGIAYLQISYRETVISWLEKCVAVAARFPMVRETIIQYINHLKQLTNQDMDTRNREEIVEMLSSIEHLRAARVIFQNYYATYDWLANKHFNPKMEEFAKQKGLEYHYDGSDDLYIKFHFTHPDWQEKYHIAFSWDGRDGCHYGLWNNFKYYRVSNENRKTLHERLNNSGVVFLKEFDWWPVEVLTPNLSLDVWENNIIKTDIYLKDCIQKTEQLLSVMEGITL